MKGLRQLGLVVGILGMAFLGGADSHGPNVLGKGCHALTSDRAARGVAGPVAGRELIGQDNGARGEN